MASGYAFVNLKNGKSYHYSLEEKPDGYFYFVSTTEEIPSEYKRNTKLVSSRNWMQAEGKAQDEFIKIRKDLQNKGKYKNSYSSIWSEPSPHSFNYSYEKKPAEVTRIKRYGTHPEYLGFEVHKNRRYSKENGRYEYDTTFYTISWDPTTPITLQIRKHEYKNGIGADEVNLSDVIKQEDKEGVKRLIKQFKELYTKEKMEGTNKRLVKV